MNHEIMETNRKKKEKKVLHRGDSNLGSTFSTAGFLPLHQNPGRGDTLKARSYMTECSPRYLLASIGVFRWKPISV